MSERNRSKSRGIVPGSRVALREEVVGDARPHLRAHAMHRDIGTVVEARRITWPEWIHVRFDGCSMVHRLAQAEIVLAQRSKS